MSGRSSKKGAEAPSKKSHGSAPDPKPKSKSAKSDDWSEVTDAEERRRIQNRIAQRKFREKHKQKKQEADRESRNKEHAASSYQIPNPSDLSPDHDVSGLPWGGMNLGHVITKGHDSHSRKSSGRGDYSQEDARYLNPYGEAYGYTAGGHAYTAGGSSGGEEAFPEGDSYYYDYDHDGGQSSQQDFLTNQAQFIDWRDVPQLDSTSASSPFSYQDVLY